MFRTLVGAGVGVVVGVLVLAGCGAWYGYENGVPTARLPPGLHAAGVSAFTTTVFLFWMGMLPGGLIGGVAGFASWLVRPAHSRPRAGRSR